jgi:peptidoglycan/LPS O-acetylase OafA/YrhL
LRKGVRSCELARQEGEPIDLSNAPSARPALDALTSLRFFAAMYVLILHSGSTAIRQAVNLPAPLVNFLKNGWSGVSLFFVLSGFILVYAYRGRLKTSAEVKSFFVARFARIYPVYLLAMILSIPIGMSAYTGPALPQFVCLQSWNFLWGGSLVANWNMPAWTISVELFFYVTFPFVFWTIRTWKLPALCAFIAVLAVLIFLVNPNSAGETPAPILLKLPVVVQRWFEFLLGMCLGLIYLQWRAPDALRYAPHVSIAATLAILCSTSDWIVASWAIYGYAAVIFTIATCMRDGLLKRFLTTEWLYFLGGASYALYITQTPVRFLIGLATDGTVFSTPARLAYIPLMILWSCLLFKYVEEPCRRYINGLGAPRKVAPRNA